MTAPTPLPVTESEEYLPSPDACVAFLSAAVIPSAEGRPTDMNVRAGLHAAVEQDLARIAGITLRVLAQLADSRRLVLTIETHGQPTVQLPITSDLLADIYSSLAIPVAAPGVPK
jgi:hypothetical protein